MTATKNGGNVQLAFPTQTGGYYTVLYRNSLNGAGTWTPLSASVTGDGTVKTVTDSLSAAQQRYYKLLIQ